MTDPVWWFYLFWLPKYLQETFGLALTQIMLPTVVVYAVSSIGSIGAGWLSGSLIDRGWSLNAARKTVMLACALAVVPVMYAPYSKNLWMVVGVVSLAAAAHQGWSAVLFTFTSDVFPRGAVGSVVGIGGTLGSHRRRAHAIGHRLPGAVDPQLHGAIPDLRVRLSGGAGRSCRRFRRG